LREKDIENISQEEAGKNVKDAFHIEKYHINDIKNALFKYETANIFYDKFPIRSRLSIGIPLFISGLFIAMYPWSKKIESNLGNNLYSVIVLLIAIVPLFIIYRLIVNTISDLRDSKS